MFFSKRIYKLFIVFFLLNAINGLDSNSKNHTELSKNLQIEPLGYFDIEEEPVIILNTFDQQIAPNTRGNTAGKSPAEADKEAAAAFKKSRKKLKTQLPAFLFNGDAAKIQSNKRNIEHDTRHNFVYERNIIVEPSLPQKKLSLLDGSKDKGDDTQGIPKKKLKQMSLKRRSFKQLKGQGHQSGRRHKEAKFINSPHAQHNNDLIINEEDITVTNALLRPKHAVVVKGT